MASLITIFLSRYPLNQCILIHLDTARGERDISASGSKSPWSLSPWFRALKESTRDPRIKIQWWTCNATNQALAHVNCEFQMQCKIWEQRRSRASTISKNRNKLGGKLIQLEDQTKSYEDHVWRQSQTTWTSNWEERGSHEKMRGMRAERNDEWELRGTISSAVSCGYMCHANLKQLSTCLRQLCLRNATLKLQLEN